MGKTIQEDIAELVPKEVINLGETPTESQPEKIEEESAPAPSPEEQKVEAPADGAKPEEPAAKQEVPFHKHPRWIRMQNELKTAREEARLAREKAEVQPVATPTEQQEVPREFQQLFGDDYQSYKSWQTMLKAEARREAEQIIAERLSAEQTQKQQEESAKNQAITWAEEQFSELADETGLDLTDEGSTERNQILDIIVEYGLFDNEGRPKVREASKLRAALYAATPSSDLNVKKQILSKTTSRSNTPAIKDEIFTPSKLREIEKRGGLAQFFK